MTSTSDPTTTTTTPTAATLYTITAGWLHRHRRCLRPRPGHRGPLVPLAGRRPNRPQGHLGRPAQAAARCRPPHPGRRGHRPLRRLSALCHSRAHRRYLDHQAHAPAGLWRLARAGLHHARRVRHRARAVPAAGPGRSAGTRTASPLPGPAQSPAAAPLLGRPGSGSGVWPRTRSRRCKPPASSPTTAGPHAAALKADLAHAVAAGTLTLDERKSHRQSTTPPTREKGDSPCV